MKVSRHKRKRIFFLFFAGIGLPSLFLAYLAFRGIQNDRALVEKNKLDEHRRLSGLITREVDENISKVEQTLLDTIADRRGDSQPAFISSLESFKQQYSLVEEVFLFENLKRIHFPAAKLLFLPDGSMNPFFTSDWPTSLAGKMQISEQMEFQQKKYQKALAAYQQAFDQASDVQMKGKLLNAIARVQKKSELFQDAIKSYKTISRSGEFCLAGWKICSIFSWMGHIRTEYLHHSCRRRRTQADHERRKACLSVLVAGRKMDRVFGAGNRRR